MLDFHKPIFQTRKIKMIVNEQQVRRALRTVQKERQQQDNFPNKTVKELVDAINNKNPHRLKSRVTDLIGCSIFEDELNKSRMQQSA